MAYKHEIYINPSALAFEQNRTPKNASLTESHLMLDMENIADKICQLKGWKVGLSCMLVVRDSQGKKSTWFVINQVLDTAHRVSSVPDLNKNTPSLNVDTHCIMSTRGNGPNRYGGFVRLKSDMSKHTITRIV